VQLRGRHCEKVLFAVAARSAPWALIYQPNVITVPPSIPSSASPVDVIGCIFQGTTASALNLPSSSSMTASIAGCRFSACQAGQGGAIFGSAVSQGLIAWTEFSGCSASGQGGGAVRWDASSGTVAWDCCVFSNCRATGSSGAGGSINGHTPPNWYLRNTNMTLSQAGGEGGAYRARKLGLVQCCHFTSVTSGTGGGAIKSEQSSTDNVEACSFVTIRGGMINIGQSGPTFLRRWFWDVDTYRHGGSTNQVVMPECHFDVAEANLGTFSSTACVFLENSLVQPICPAAFVWATVPPAPSPKESGVEVAQPRATRPLLDESAPRHRTAVLAATGARWATGSVDPAIRRDATLARRHSEWGRGMSSGFEVSGSFGASATFERSEEEGGSGGGLGSEAGEWTARALSGEAGECSGALRGEASVGEGLWVSGAGGRAGGEETGVGGYSEAQASR
jgi:hypothetical protein